jgi:hypothetical protein
LLKSLLVCHHKVVDLITVVKLVETSILNFYFNVFDFGLVLLDFNDLLNGMSYVLDLKVLGKIFLFLVEDGVVQDVMDEVVNKLGSACHLVSAIFESDKNSCHLLYHKTICTIHLELFYEGMEVSEEVLHGTDLANHGVEWVPELMAHSSVDHLQELLFCLRVIVEHLVADVYDLQQIPVIKVFHLQMNVLVGLLKIEERGRIIVNVDSEHLVVQKVFIFRQ